MKAGLKKLGFIGGGNMAEALVRGLLENKIFKPGDLIVSDVDPLRRRKLARSLKIETTADNLTVLRDSRALLLAVKPQNIDDVLDEMAAAMRAADETNGGAGRKPSHAAGKRGRTTPTSISVKPADRLFISIAAGITL